MYCGLVHILSRSSDSKASVRNAGDPGSICESGISPGEGNGNPLQHTCLENPMDGGAWQDYSPGGCKEADTAERLHLYFFCTGGSRSNRGLRKDEKYPLREYTF